MIFTIIAFFSLIVVIISTFVAIRGWHRLYWASAIGIYVFSFLAGFSIGQLTVSFTFIPLVLALGFSLGWINSKVQYVSFLCLGILLSVLVVIFDIGNWLFYPFFFLLG